MAYYDQRAGTSERAVAATLVTVLQIGVVVALVHGLAVAFIPRSEPPLPLKGEQIYLPPPPPMPKPSEKPVIDTKTPNEAKDAQLYQDRHDSNIILPPVGPPVRETDVRLDPPLPPPSAGLARSVRPLNSPGSWVTQDDYSSSDIRAERQGTARFTLSIGTDGKVKSCSIVQSTGFASLDAATCKYVSRRARFETALDDAGAPATGSYSGSIRWVIP